MIRNLILPAIGGIIAALAFFAAGGPLIRMLPLGDSVKGLLIIAGTLIVGVIVNNLLTKALKK